MYWMAAIILGNTLLINCTDITEFMVTNQVASSIYKYVRSLGSPSLHEESRGFVISTTHRWTSSLTTLYTQAVSGVFVGRLRPCFCRETS